MSRTVAACIEHFPLHTPFQIACGARTEISVVRVVIEQDGRRGTGECTPTARYGETPETVVAQIEAVRAVLGAGAGRQRLRHLLPPGAARNAIDAALWELASRLRNRPPETVQPIVSAQTISLGSPEAMSRAAARLQDARLVKVKLDGNNPQACLRAVRAALPYPILIVDANEGWTMPLLRDMQPVLAEARIAFIEQPLPASDDMELCGFTSAVPICADESCHVSADIDRLRDRYDMINIKLDKAGGLTEAFALLEAARGAGMGVMVGCMLATSLGISPALLIAARADYVDLDGPCWLSEDRSGAMGMAPDGTIIPPQTWCFV